MIRRLSGLLSVCALAVLVACGAPPATVPAGPGAANDPVSREAGATNAVTTNAVSQGDLPLADLTRNIMAMGPGIDPEEASRAARVAYQHTAELARAYQITDPPLIHNTKVNMGIKPRGLCWHWAQDMEKRMKQERFQTLDLHRAVANFDNLRLEHSTLIISAKGQPMAAGVVLDPWRKGGVLYWSPVAADTRYDWHPRDEVLAFKRERDAKS